MVKLADALDSKSSGSDTVPVQVRPAAPKKQRVTKELSVFLYGSVDGLEKRKRAPTNCRRNLWEEEQPLEKSSS